MTTTVDTDWALLRKAATVKRDFVARGRRLSYVDAIGYALARRESLPFLTGDPAFKGMEGVEFLAAANAKP